jgi:hypothetical protein
MIGPKNITPGGAAPFGGAHGEGCDPVLLTAELFWRLFEATGSIRAYLLYKRLSVQ